MSDTFNEWKWMMDWCFECGYSPAGIFWESAGRAFAERNSPPKPISCFLGGTMNGSAWREAFIPLLDKRVSCFNPVVNVWTPDAKQEELERRRDSDYLLYVLSPCAKGVYSVAELVEDSCFAPERTLFVFLASETVGGKTFEFDAEQIASMEAVAALLKRRRARAFPSLADAAHFLNGCAEQRFKNSVDKSEK